MDPAWLLSTLLWMLSVKMSFSTELDILLNVKALNRRGVLNLKPRSDLVAFPHGLVDVRETAQFFSQAQTSIVAISESNWGEIFLKQESPTSCGVVTARNHAQMLADLWRKRDSVCPLVPQASGSECASHHQNVESVSIFGDKTESQAIEMIQRLVPTFATNGLTLDQLCLHVVNSTSYEVWRNGEDQTGFTVTDFRDVVEDQVTKYGSLIVNYDMSTLGQIPAGGHFSLVAGLIRRQGISSVPDDYFVLLLDCWPETPVAWVPIEALFRAMNTPDRGNGGKFRGFLRRI